MSKWIKNVDTVTNTWVGQQLSVDEYYQIQDYEDIQWMNDSTLLIAISSGKAVVAKDDSGTNDIIDINKAVNYLKDLQTELEIDSDGRQIVKSATTYKGWRYLAHPMEIETSKLEGTCSKDWQGACRSDYSLRFYDDQDVELVAGTQTELDSNCVKTVVNFSPDHDYDLMGGNIHQYTTPAQDIKLWVIAGAIELGAAGVREFVGGLNFKFITPGSTIRTDGRASVRLNKITTGIAYATNQMEFILTHPVGFNHQVMVVLEYFR